MFSPIAGVRKKSQKIADLEEYLPRHAVAAPAVEPRMLSMTPPGAVVVPRPHVGIDLRRSRHWFVEHDQLGFVDESGGQLDALRIAVRGHVDLALCPVGNAETLKPHLCRRMGFSGSQTVQSARVLDLVPYEHSGGTDRVPRACTRTDVALAGRSWRRSI
jgi:hypothetical protein